MSTARQIPERLRAPNENHAEWLLRRIWNRVNRSNEHFMGVVVGQEGKGKSYTAIKISHELDPSFDDSRVIFDVVELLKILKNEEHEPGQFYVLDEAGVQLGRRTWQERSQILANQALQLIRKHNLGLFFTLPKMSELDSQTEGRLQALYNITRKKDGEYVTGKWKWVEQDREDESGQVYKKYPRRRLGQGGVAKRLERFSFRPPPEWITEPYEEAKDAFNEQFYEKTIKALEDVDEDDEEEISVPEIAAKLANNGLGDVVDINGTNGQAYINRELVRVHCDVSQADAIAIKSIIEKQYSAEELSEYV